MQAKVAAAASLSSIRSDEGRKESFALVRRISLLDLFAPGRVVPVTTPESSIWSNALADGGGWAAG